MRKVVILGGGGLMGHGIALACLRSVGTEVVLVSRRQESLDHGVALLQSGPFGMDKTVERGKFSRVEADEMLARLRVTLDFEEGLADADLVIESIPEVLDLKKETLTRAGRAAPASAIFASGTSSIMISELSSALEDPGRLVGTHWFYPANVMPLVEVARGELSRDDAIERVLDFLRTVGKRPVLVGDSPGFFMTRFINLYIAEAIRLLEIGVAGLARSTRWLNRVWAGQWECSNCWTTLRASTPGTTLRNTCTRLAENATRFRH